MGSGCSVSGLGDCLTSSSVAVIELSDDQPRKEDLCTHSFLSYNRDDSSRSSGQSVV